MIDKNNGEEFPASLLSEWRAKHEKWVRHQLNKSVEDGLTVIDGDHKAEGIGNVTALDIQKGAILRPGTKSIARGVGNITGTKIS